MKRTGTNSWVTFLLGNEGDKKKEVLVQPSSKALSKLELLSRDLVRLHRVFAKVQYWCLHFHDDYSPTMMRFMFKSWFHRFLAALPREEIIDFFVLMCWYVVVGGRTRKKIVISSSVGRMSTVFFHEN